MRNIAMMIILNNNNHMSTIPRLEKIMLSNDMFTIWIMTIMTIPILDHDNIDHNMILNIVPKN